MPIRGKITTTTKLSINLTLYKAYRNHCTNLRLEGIKKKKEFTLKPGKRRFKHNKFSKIIMKRQRNTIQMKKQTRNTEVQINEEEIGKLLKKNSE